MEKCHVRLQTKEIPRVGKLLCVRGTVVNIHHPGVGRSIVSVCREWSKKKKREKREDHISYYLDVTLGVQFLKGLVRSF